MKTKKSKFLLFIIILIISIIALFMMAYHQLKISNKEYNYGYNNLEFSRGSKQKLNLAEVKTLQQKFKCKYDNLEKIEINFKTKENKEFEVNVKLEDLTENKIIKDEKINSTNLLADGSYVLQIENQDKSKNKEYAITLDFLDTENSELAISYVQKNIAKGRKTFVDGEEFKGTLEINEYYKSTQKELLFNLVTIISVIIVVSVAIFIYSRNNITAEKAFLYTIPIICVMFLVVMPMFKSHDEQRHWLRAYEISEGKLFSQVHDEKVESSLPKSVINTLDKYWRYINYNDIKKAMKVTLDENDREYTNMSYVAVYSPIQYVPQALGISIARLFTNRVLIMAYAARIANLIVSLGILYLAIKTIPFGKKFLLLASMFPLSIEAFSSMSPDALTISIAFLFIAYVLKLAFGETEKISKKNIAILSLLSVIIAFCKIVYIPLVFLMFLIPKTKFKNNKSRYAIIISIIVVALILNIGWLAIANSYLSVSSGGISGGQISGILQHPIEYIRIFLHSLNVNGQRYLTSLFGGELGWNEFSLYFFVPYIFLALFLFVSCTDKKTKNKFKLWQKILITCIILVIVALIFTSLYVQWTKPGDTKINGVQGRYFIPFIPLVAIILNGVKINSDYKEENLIKTIAITALVLQVYILLTIVINHL